MSAVPRPELIARLQGAYALAGAGRHDEAEAALRALIAEQPDFIPARDDLCVLLLSAGRALEAESEARSSLARRPSGPDALNNLASALLRQQRGTEAVAPLEEALRLRPEFAEAWFSLAWARLAGGDRGGAAAALRRAVALRPADPRYLSALSALLRDRGWPDEALTYARQAYALAPDQPAVRITLARALRLAGDVDEALALLEASGPQPPVAVLSTLAQMRWEAGDMDGAIEAAEAALVADPRDLVARGTIVNAQRVTAADDPNVAAIEAALRDPALDRSDRTRCHYSLGKARDDLGDHAAAFVHHRAANELRKQHGPRYDHQRELDVEAASRALCADGAFARLAAHGSRDPRPVFVVGMPRSGTSLVEQIMSAHPQVSALGERLEVTNLARRLNEADLARGGRGYPAALATLDGAVLAKHAEQLLAGMVARAGGAAVRIVDKMPLNLRHLGLIHALLPQARVVVCNRDPLDNCVSIYFQNFGFGHPYSEDLVDTARFYAHCQRMLALWREALPLQRLEVRYEDLVADPEAGARRLIAFLDLPWDERCARAHEVERPVRTASAWQVKQPIYKSSVDRWRRYGGSLAPLIEALRAEGVPLPELEPDA